jgi:hypothetical protein
MNVLTLLAVTPLLAPVLGQASSTAITLPTIAPSTTTSETTILTHTGPFDETTRENPTLNFFEKYVATITGDDPGNVFPNFYAPESVFYDANSIALVGGESIAAGSGSVFGIFERIEVNHHNMRVLPYESTSAAGDEGPGDLANVAANCKKVGTCTQLLTEHDMVFFLNAPLDGPGIPVRRAMSWVLGPTQVAGQGTDGKQWYQSKVWWDEKILFDEIAKRNATAGSN